MSYQDFLKFQKEYEEKGYTKAAASIAPIETAIPQSSSSDILDDIFKNTVSRPNSTPFTPQNESKLALESQERVKNTTNYNYPDAVDKLGAFGNAGLNSVSLGLKPLIESKVAPRQYEMSQKVMAENPKTAIAGNISGYLLPGVAIEKAAIKALPLVFSGLKPLTKAVGGAIASGAIMGGVEGATEGVKDNLSLKDTLSNMTSKSYDTALMGGVGTAALGGAAKGISNVYGNTIGYNKAMQRTGQAIDNYQFPQLRELQTVPRPTLKPTINPELPIQYRPSVPKGVIPEMPLALPPASRSYNVAPEFKTEITGMPTRITPKNESYVLSNNINPESLQGLERDIFNSYSKAGTLSKSGLNDLRNQLINENNIIMDEHINWLNSGRGNKPSPGTLMRDAEGVVTGRQGRISNNEEWYSQFYKENGRPPNKGELQQIADNHLSNGFGAKVGGNLPKNDIYLQNKEVLKAVDSLLNKVDAVQSNLKPVKINSNINSSPTPQNTLKSSLNSKGMQVFEVPNMREQVSPSISPKSRYTQEVQSQLDDLERSYRNTINDIKSNKVISSELKSKRTHAEGIKYSAAKREVIQGDSLVPVDGGLTTTELSNKIAKLKTNYRGKEVITPDGEGIVTGQSSFGKVGVKVGDRVIYYPKEQIQAKVNIDEVISRQKQATVKPVSEVNALSNINSPSTPKSTFKPQNTANVTGDIKTGNVKQRKFISNSFMNSDVPTPKMKAEMSRNMPTYPEISNKKTLEEANKIIGNDIQKHATEFLSTPDLDGAIDTAKGISLIQKLTAKGDDYLANEVSISLAEKLTKRGQEIQAASIMRRMTPEGMLQYANKTINKANKQLISKAGNKPVNKIKLTAEETKFITDTMVEIQNKTNGMIVLPIDLQMFADSKVAEVMKLIAGKIPANMGEKIKTFQRINLLLNPKTMIRNLAGNTISSAVANAKDVLATGIDNGVSKITGQRTTLLPDLKTQWQGAKKGFQRVKSDYKKGINTAPTGTQYEIDGRTISPFKNKALMNLDELTKTGLRMADDPFYQSAYEDILRREMKLKGVDTPTPEMIIKADQIARERTFQDKNKITELFTGLQKSLNKIGTKNFGLGNVVLPFVKTPANILARALEYSPIELGKVTKELYNAASKNGKFDQYKFVDSLAKSITGTALIGAGYGLAESGIITGASSKDKDARNFESSVGILPYSFKAGDNTYTYDWMQPSSIPLAIGADIYFNLKRSKDPTNVLIDAGKSGVNTLFSQSLLQGLNKMFGGSGYSGGSDIATNLTNTALSATTQFMPLGSILRQTGEVIDPYKRDTSDESMIKSKAINPLINTVPGLRQTLPAKINTVGETVKANGLIDTFINPARSSDYNGNVTYDELLRLNSQGGENKQFPTTATNSISYKTSKNGESEKVTITPEQLANFKSSLGQSNMQAIQKAMQTPEYRNGNDKQKADIISNAMSKNKQEQETNLLKQLNINEYKATTSSRGRKRR